VVVSFNGSTISMLGLTPVATRKTCSRGYNSGSINFNDLNDPQGAIASYVSDVANRLQVSLLFEIEEHETNEARDGMVMMVRATELLVDGRDRYMPKLNAVVRRK
jgi:hypothetical protein